jgi:hypothetical protein
LGNIAYGGEIDREQNFVCDKFMHYNFVCNNTFHYGAAGAFTGCAAIIASNFPKRSA